MVTLTLRPEANLETCPIWDVAVNGKPVKVFLEYHKEGMDAWVPGEGYVGFRPASVCVVDNRRKKGQRGTSFRFVEGPNALTDLVIDLLNRLT